ncbi:MAG: TlyA family RNA methyltransferase [Actinomycetota bacterium]|nr:TlyA family RNA methyltransferase [Actinomycetota bacterium]MDQ3926407.1 TlyA family RNA methyltransferase [Actinomycetota bacterium]
MSGIEAINDPAEAAKGAKGVPGLPRDASRRPKLRLDALLVERGLAESRARAQALVLSGAVRAGGESATKAGLHVAPDVDLHVETPRESSFVSRAGEKIAYALDTFGVEVEDRDCLDAGASTGGFTDALLRRGAQRVIAVDVGYGQLDWSLRNDPRVVVMERTNVRYLSSGDLPFAPDLLVADLSFISLVVALSNLFSTTPSIREAVVLVKPQFEAGPRQVSRGGLVHDPAVRAKTVRRVAEAFESLGFGALNVARSPVVGRRAGNVEYLLRLLRGAEATLGEEQILAVVRSEP